MKIFDLHADIGYDVMQKRAQGETEILNKYHLAKFRQGDVQYVNMASYFEGSEDWSAMQKMILSLKEEIACCEEIDLVLCSEDLMRENGHIKAILSVEGMCGIREQVEDKITWLYEQGVRIGSFCWNDENALATGVRGKAERGLTAMGKTALHTMRELHMMVDISHANEKTFWDIVEADDGMLMATHSNARALCDHPRNLWDQQVQAIKEHGGYLGVVSAPVFVSTQKEQQDIPHLIEHITYLCQLLGDKQVMLGFDFMDYYQGYENFHTHDLPDTSYAQNIVKELRKQGRDEDWIADICYRNAVSMIQKLLEKNA